MFPGDFIHSIQASLPVPEANQLLQAMEAVPPVSIRLNPSKPASLPWSMAGTVPWCTDGHYLPERPLFTLDPLLHGGAYYVQEASSMCLAHIVQQLTPQDAGAVVALDLCAAPGGKSTLLASSLPQGSLLVANEIIRSRVHILAENLSKWGQPNVVVANSDPRDFGSLHGLFDLVVVDAPCSGEGMFRKDPKARQEWSPANVQLCAERQQRILGDVWPALKEGGYLVYSTCTYNTQENEQNVDWLCRSLGAEAVEVAMQAEWQATPSEAMAGNWGGVKGYRFFPHKTRGEGFFVAVVRKTSAAKNYKPVKGGKGAGAKQAVPLPTLREWLLPQLDVEVVALQQLFVAYPARYMGLIQQLQQHIKLYQAGVLLAEAKGKDLLPTVQLALSVGLYRPSFAMLEVDKATALRYLRREAIEGAQGVRGYQLVCYEGIPLGFIKNIGDRSNNLYPQEWRIRNL